MAPLERGDWDNLFRAIHRVAKYETDHGTTVVTVRVILSHGVCTAWTRPILQVIEPTGAGEAILNLLCDGPLDKGL